MSRLSNLRNLIADPEFQRQIQVEIRRKAAEHNSSIIYRDESNRLLVEYPGSGQIYEQNEANQLTLLSVQGQLAKGVTPISKAEADQVQTT